jgi:YHS domain-containing protein
LAVSGAIWLIFLAGIMTPQIGRASPEDRLVVNADTGLAISGFDPVAYFSRHKAVVGEAQFELTQNGNVWRFVNEGNRAAFADHPEVYTPRFGGYDPVAINRGVSVPGNSLIWAVADDRLYLFYDDKARAAFLANPGAIIEGAMRNWPEVARAIAR